MSNSWNRKWGDTCNTFTYWPQTWCYVCLQSTNKPWVSNETGNKATSQLRLGILSVLGPVNRCLEWNSSHPVCPAGLFCSLMIFLSDLLLYISHVIFPWFVYRDTFFGTFHLFSRCWPQCRGGLQESVCANSECHIKWNIPMVLTCTSDDHV